SRRRHPRLVSDWSSDVYSSDLPCQYGSREAFAMMLALQSSPIEMSTPSRVFSPLWHATHRSEVRNTVPGGTLSPFAFSVFVCEWPRTNGRNPATASPSTIGPPQWSLI